MQFARYQERIDRLSVAQREGLAACVSLVDRREVRAATGLGEDVIAQTISGESFDHAVVDRIVHFLDEVVLGGR